MNNLERGWMYERLDGRGAINSSFIIGMDKFIQFTCSQQNRLSGEKVRCPCKKCHNFRLMGVEIVKHHLYKTGFVDNYFVWKHQGKKNVINEISSGPDLHGSAQPELTYDNSYRQMVLDASCPNFPQGSSWQSSSNIEPQSTHPCEPLMKEDHNPDSKKLYDLLQATDQKLYPGSFLSQLALVSRMLNIKMENNMS